MVRDNNVKWGRKSTWGEWVILYLAEYIWIVVRAILLIEVNNYHINQMIPSTSEKIEKKGPVSRRRTVEAV